MASAAEWVERVRAWQESGLKAEEFAAGKDFRAKTLVWWSSELKRRAKRTGEGSPSRSAARRAVTKSVKMARVLSAPSKSQGTLIVVVGGVAVEVQRGFDRTLLAEVVDALGAAR